ncbi:uncharacterized protein LOC121629794 [Melanotaenia boesemani]|uniref:uncharacterized protein LOC121629794 n=1 Tax=Melanotaenia boesemani TaxID=1250792 RepID=UPI001C03CB81|nr:uncharacterized protein LOC121629794 [Melanotaenia boesemani]
MDQLDKRLIEEVRKYCNLYDATSRNYKDAQMSSKSWKEIADVVGLEVPECMKRWKNLRDKYVRVKRKMSGRNGEAGGQKTPAFFILLSWLAPHIRHRETQSNLDKENNPTSESPTPTSASESFLSLSASNATSSPKEEEEDFPSSPECPAPLSAPKTQTSSSPSVLVSASPTARSLTKRRRRNGDEWVKEQLQLATERRIAAEERLLAALDEEGRFCSHLADVLRKIPEETKTKRSLATTRFIFCGLSVLQIFLYAALHI